MWVFKFDEGGDGKQANDDLTLSPLYNISFYIATFVTIIVYSCMSF